MSVSVLSSFDPSALSGNFDTQQKHCKVLLYNYSGYSVKLTHTTTSDTWIIPPSSRRRVYLDAQDGKFTWVSSLVSTIAGLVNLVEMELFLPTDCLPFDDLAPFRGGGGGGSGSPFALFAHAENYAGSGGGGLPDTGGTVTATFTSPAGGLALILLDVEFRSDVGGMYQATLKIDGAGSDIGQLNGTGWGFSQDKAGTGSAVTIETNRSNVHKAFVVTLPSGTHTLVLTLTRTFASSAYDVGASIKVLYN